MANITCPECGCHDVQVSRSITMRTFPDRKTLHLHSCTQCRVEWYADNDKEK